MSDICDTASMSCQNAIKSEASEPHYEKSATIAPELLVQKGYPYHDPFFGYALNDSLLQTSNGMSFDPMNGDVTVGAYDWPDINTWPLYQQIDAQRYEAQPNVAGGLPTPPPENDRAVVDPEVEQRVKEMFAEHKKE